MLIFIDSRGIPTSGQGVGHMRIFISNSCDLHFSEIILQMRLGPHGEVDGIYGFVWGCHTHKND